MQTDDGISGEEMTVMFATRWIDAEKLLRKVIELHRHGFVMDGVLADDIRTFLGDAPLVPRNTTTDTTKHEN
jgi:hypothetical protein